MRWNCTRPVPPSTFASAEGEAVNHKSHCVLVAASLLVSSDSNCGVAVTPTRGQKPTQAEKLPRVERLPKGGTPPAEEAHEAGDGLEKPANIAVEGYASARYVYGEVEDLGRGEIAGYIYQPGRGRTYVYGEAAPTVGLIYAYDNEGKRYVLSMKKGADDNRGRGRR